MHLHSFPQHIRTLLAMMALIPTLLIAQDTGTITGRVLDIRSGVFLEGAEVRVVGTSLQTTSARGGAYLIHGVPAGARELEAAFIGLETVAQSVQVTPNGTVVADLNFGDQVVELDPYVINSAAMGQAQALNLRRGSENIASFVSADAIGQFPDQNAAEALSRLPGISVERDQGEGRFVVVRGIDPNLTNVAIDGVDLASPSAGERATLLDTVPTDTLQRLEVNKAVLPSMPGNSIGGYINIKTPSAYDFDSTVLRVGVQGNYSDLTDSWKPKLTASYGDTFSDGRIGFMISASHEEREFGSDNNEADPWEMEDGEDGTSGYTTGDVQFREYNLTRERTGITGNLEFRPNTDSAYFVRGSWNEYKDTEIRHSGIFGPDGFNAITNNSFEAVDAEHVREMKDREENMRIAAVSAGGRNTLGSFDLEYTVSYSNAEEDTPYDFESIYELADTAGVRFTGTYGYELGIEQLSGPDFTNPDNYEFDEVTSASQLVKEEDYSGKIDLTYRFEQDFVDRIQGGVLVRRKNKTSDLEEFASDDNPPAVENFSDFSMFDNRDFRNTGLPYVAESFRSYFLENEDGFAMERSEGDSAIEDFDSDEDVAAAYLMGVFDWSGTEIIAGARFESTDFSTTGFVYNDDDETVVPASAENDYDHFLPGLFVRRPFSENMVLRFSANQTIARPNFSQTQPGAEIEGDEVTVGNPYLDAIESTNIDLSIEYYLAPLGIISGSIFYKDIKNFIYEQTVSGDFGGIQDAEITTFRNGPSGDIKGIELSAQKQLDFLPAPFDGLGIFANLTLIDAEATVLPAEEGGDMRTVPFVKQSEVVGNLALTYETGRFFFRIAGSFRESYLDEVGEEPFEDRYVDDFFQVDITTHYRITDNFTVYANVLNITNEPLRAFFDESGRLSQFEEYGLGANLGLRWSY